MRVAQQAPSWLPLARLDGWARPYGIVVGLMLLVSVLGFRGLDDHVVTFDESFSISHAHESWIGLWHVVTEADPNMSLYFAILKVWTGIFGDSLFAVRGFSVVAAALCVPVVYAIGGRLFGVRAGLLAGLLLSTNAFFIHYAHEARSYTLVTLLAALSTYFFLVEIEQPNRWIRFGYVASSVLAFYAQFFVVWVLLVHVGTLVATKKWAAFTARWLVCYATMAALAAPMVYAVVRGQLWVTIQWIPEPDIGSIPATYAQLAGDSFVHLGVIVAVTMLALRNASRSQTFGLAFTAAWAFLPLLAVFALAQVGPSFLAKYLIVSLPAMMLLAAGAVACIRSVSIGVAVACILVALSVPKLLNPPWFG